MEKEDIDITETDTANATREVEVKKDSEIPLIATTTKQETEPKPETKTETKRQLKRSTSHDIIIQTHDGKFHADECAAISLLTSFYGSQGYKVSVLRSRDSNKFVTSNILVDVGLQYNHELNRYDHHQKECNETWFNSTIPLSSVGLIWKHFGCNIVELYLHTSFQDYEYDAKIITDLVNMIYFRLIQDLDAHDNGITYNSSNFNIPALISSMNGDTSDAESQDIAFHKAVTLLGTIFDIKFKEIINSYFNYSKDLDFIKESLETVYQTEDGSTQENFLILNQQVPTVYKCLNKLDPECKIAFLIFTDEKAQEYSIKTRNQPGEKYLPICSIAPEEDLKKNIDNFADNVIFIHKGLFTAKCRNLATAIKIVTLSTIYYREKKHQLYLHKLHEFAKDETADGTILISNLNEYKSSNKLLISLGIASACLGLYYLWKE